MSNFDKERFDRRIKWGLLVTSVGTIVLLGLAAVRENIYAPWREYRLHYADVLNDKATDEQGIELAASFEIGINQNFVPELALTDRCITCHAGLDDPRMADQPNPYRTHPGSFLQIHPPEQFGCTTCHQGQGLATEPDAAHGHVEFWPHPMAARAHMYNACAQCHDERSLYGDEALPAKAMGGQPSAAWELSKRGRELVNTKGCLGCHQLRGRGGTLGPDISHVGDKAVHDFDFSHFDRHAPRTVAHWLEQHFLDPAAVSPGTVMPVVAMNPEDAAALTAYMLSLKRSQTLANYRAPEPLDRQEPPPPTGAELYAQMCSSCHGEDGRINEMSAIRTPSLNNVDTLATSTDDYLRYIIENGRSGTAMPAWGGEDGTITRAETDKLVKFIRNWEPEPADPETVSARMGDPAMGASYYAGLCANCHGVNGDGDIGNALNSSTFLSIVSDAFLARTIIEGRPGTAMASWKHLPGQAVSDLVAYIRTWESAPPTFSEVLAANTTTSNPNPHRPVGAILYKGNCATCHGGDGEGGIGPRLNSPNIIPAMDDQFLYKTIVHGRREAGMPAWKSFDADDVASIMQHLRSWNGGGRVVPAKAPSRGDYALGQVHYAVSCAACHGDKAQGGVGPQLSGRSFLSAVSDDLLYQWIAHGRTGTAMQGFLHSEQGPTELAPGHIADIIAYLRYLGAQNAPPVYRSGIGDTKVGANLYKETCAGCHGNYGEGASGPQLNNPTFLRSASDGFLAATIVLGRTGTPMRSMIHGQDGIGQIDTKNVQDIIGYMRQWDFESSRRKPRPVAEMSTRAIDSGRDKFARFCAGCHGANGRGAADGEGHFAPALNNPEFLTAASDGFLLATIARGRSNTPMRPFGIGAGGIATLNGGEISDIVSFIRSWNEVKEDEEYAKAD